MTAHALPAPAMDDAALALDPAVQLLNVWFGYHTRQPVLRGVSISARPGQVTVLLGASGSGKTTLLKLIKGLLPVSQGDISVLGRSSSAGGRRAALDPRVAYIPQQLGLVRNLSVLDNVLLGAMPRIGTARSLVHWFPRDEVAAAHEALSTLGIGHKAGERVLSLSGGERQRVAIARALMQRARVIVADEFLSQLDPVTTDEIMGVMRKIADQGVALVMTTHELDVVMRHADQVVVLRNGAVALALPPAAVTTELLASAIRQ